jgi:hypothetical protein
MGDTPNGVLDAGFDDAEGYDRRERRSIPTVYSRVFGQACRNLDWNGVREVSPFRITALEKR